MVEEKAQKEDYWVEGHGQQWAAYKTRGPAVQIRYQSQPNMAGSDYYSPFLLIGSGVICDSRLKKFIEFKGGTLMFEIEQSDCQ